MEKAIKQKTYDLNLTIADNHIKIHTMDMNILIPSKRKVEIYNLFDKEEFKVRVKNLFVENLFPYKMLSFIIMRYLSDDLFKDFIDRKLFALGNSIYLSFEQKRNSYDIGIYLEYNIISIQFKGKHTDYII